VVTLKLIGKTHVVDNVWSFQFEPSRHLLHRAGQFIKVEIPHAGADDEGTKRFFTISSTPQDPFVQITTRITQSTFKQALAGIEPGSAVKLLDEPAGDFIWKPQQQNTVFIAQGIGVTPFYSMLKDRIQSDLPMEVALIYSSQSGLSLPFLPELGTWSHEHPEFKIMTPIELITPALIAALIPKLQSATIYVSSPSSLIGLTAPPYNLPVRQLKTDYFPGYSQTSY
jgi:ferredoxin-NADP reductase